MQLLTLRNRILAATGLLGFVATIVVFDLGCPGVTPTEPGVATVQVFGNASVAVGGTAQWGTILKDANGSTVSGRTVSWSSSNPAVATVGASTGVVTGISVGTVTITATSEGKTGTGSLTVTPAPLVPVATVTVSGAASVLIGASTQLTATLKDAAGNELFGRGVTWSSSDPTKASVGITSGQVTGVAVGTVTITATSEGKTGTAQLTVTTLIATITVTGPASVVVGRSITLTAIPKDAAGNDLSRTVTWSSSNPAIASVNSIGDVTGVSVGGPVTITATSEGKSGTASISVTAPIAPTILQGRVINYVTGVGIGSALVNFYDVSGGLIFFSATSIADGSFTSASFTGFSITGGVLVEAIASGFVTGRILVGSVPQGSTTFTGDLPLVPTSSMTGGISGTVRNAVSAAGIAGVSVQLFNNVNAAAVATQTSDAAGAFSFSGLAAGTYRLSASATGFQNAQRTGVAVGNGGVTAGQDLVLAPSGSSTIRIVLTWGASPPDLDSHLTGPNTDATRFHVYYASRGSLSSAPFAQLDVDNTSGFGPETITIAQMNSGTYRYSVHDYTNRNSSTSSALGASGAKVEVYGATGLLQTFFVPNQSGTLWTVFEMSGTLANPAITPRNVMGLATDPATILSPPASGVLANDGTLIWRSTRDHPKQPY